MSTPKAHYVTIDFQDCLLTYNNHGVRFDYPDIWELVEEQDGDDIMVQVSASDSCFWTMRLLTSAPPPPQVIESCVSAFTDEYDEVEVSTPERTLADMPAASRELAFFCVDLPVLVQISSVRTTDFTMLVWWQASEVDLQEARPILDHMTRSVQVDVA